MRSLEESTPWPEAVPDLDLSPSRHPRSFGRALWYVVACHAESGPLFPDDVTGIRTPGPSSPSGSVAASL